MRIGHLLVLGWIAAVCAAAAEGARRPNFILFLTDDQGWGDAALAGHPYVKTPNLDRLAREGTWFKQFYVANPVCSPSRTAFMTSHAPARHHIHGHISDPASNAARSMPNWLDPAAPMVTRLLRDAGYVTGHFGKWHLGSMDGAPSPTEYGIDIHATVNAQGSPMLGDPDKTPATGRKRSPEATDPYFRAKSTRMIVDEAIAFLSAHKDRPFYLNLWTLLPHAYLNPTPEQLAAYEHIEPRADDPAFGAWMRMYLGNAKDLKKKMQIFCASLADIDEQVGRLLTALDELGLSESTALFFTSDNGPEDYQISNASNSGVGSAGPLRARKRSLYEGGIRTLGLLRWPGRVPAGRADDACILGAVDWLPTVCRLAGVDLPPAVAPDGEDVSDIWFGATRPRSKPLYWEWMFRVWGDDFTPPMLAIRDGNWKLFANHDGGQVELYDISADPAETKSVAGDHPAVASRLTQDLLAWAAALPPSEARATAAATGERVDVRFKKAVPAKEINVAEGVVIRDRAVIFDAKDADRDGRLSYEEYAPLIADKDEARRRFSGFDADGDGFLTQDEFVNRGKSGAQTGK